jgi:predicted alpha-1,2-mannosidase
MQLKQVHYLFTGALVALLTLIQIVISPTLADEKVIDFVDPFIGTDGTGHTFPGPSMPFGMVQPGPDNADNGWEYTSGYQYKAPLIVGFSQTRASGTGIPELGDVLLQPSQTRRDEFASTYDKKSEVAEVGYYAVSLRENNVRIELTTGVRTAFHRYTFDRPGRAWVLVDLQHGLTFRVDTQPVIGQSSRVAADGIEGVMERTNWTTRTVAFSVQFDHPIVESVVLPLREGDVAPRYLLAFDLGADRTLKAKAGLSTVDVEGARANRESIAGWDFDAVRRDAEAAWEQLLSRVRIEAGLTQKRIFYTAAYHAFLHPSIINDVDGRWRGANGEVQLAEHGDRYSTLSLWDTFRAAHPLYTLLVPERVDEFVLSMLDHADAAGRLPKWPIWGGETGTMIGEPALPVIADAWSKGFRGFDGKRALDAMIRTSSEDATPIYPGDYSLSVWSLLDRFGYYPIDLTEGEAVSRALEAGIGDEATARMARMLGDPENANRFIKRSGNWRNLIDPDTRLARGRDSSGAWREPFDPLTPTSTLNNPGDFTEANAWQYTWTPALHDPKGLIEAIGGHAAFRNMLDRFFFKLPSSGGWTYLGQEAMIGQYAHGNEPSHHIAWLYAYTDTPERGRELVKRIANDFYRDAPNGIVGNEDAGQMSSWYIFATLGFYPVTPASGTYVLGSPLATEATVKVPGKRSLKISISGKGSRLDSVTLNGAKMDQPEISHEALLSGGHLSFHFKE